MVWESSLARGRLLGGAGCRQGEARPARTSASMGKSPHSPARPLLASEARADRDDDYCGDVVPGYSPVITTSAVARLRGWW